eukprot:COSAG01_NODE_7442_length_3210_cov_15.798457_4_plen_64_part_00
MGNILKIGDNCMFRPIQRDGKKCNSSAAEHNAVLQYGVDFMQQIRPLLDNPRHNGGFITSCIW